MALEVDGKTIETDANGYLVNVEDWNEQIAKVVAEGENIGELTQRHWDVINYMRDEYLNNGGNQPNVRNMVKAMQKAWDDKKVDAKSLYELFPKNPDKQSSKIGGLPETKRKGGY
jgi:tRNA 2-thiouridine synthesizing protein E